MTINFSVDYSEYGGYDRDPDPDDEWDNGDTYTEYTIKNTFRKTKWADLILKEEPKIGSDWWVVYAVYSTGSTFGHDRGGCIEWLGLYDDAVKAKECLDAFNNWHNKKTLVFKDTYGNEIKRTYKPWDGYFESLDYIDMSRVTYIGE